MLAEEKAIIRWYLGEAWNQRNLAEGDKVEWRFTVNGTHQGSFRGIAPTGKRIVLTGIAISQMLGGRLTENWNELDDLSMLQRLGVIPAPESAK